MWLRYGKSYYDILLLIPLSIGVLQWKDSVTKVPMHEKPVQNKSFFLAF